MEVHKRNKGKRHSFLTLGLDVSDQFHALAAFSLKEIDSVLIEIEY
jgi:hypothetical protein